MPKYAPITKTLKKATPTVRAADNVVKSWEIEVVYSYAGDEVNNLPAWKTSYSENEDVEYLGKTVDQFTKADLLGLLNIPQLENIFESHYDSMNAPPTETRLSNFDITQIPES
jgi:hypothetical protein